MHKYPRVINFLRPDQAFGPLCASRFRVWGWARESVSVDWPVTFAGTAAVMLGDAQE